MKVRHNIIEKRRVIRELITRLVVGIMLSVPLLIIFIPLNILISHQQLTEANASIIWCCVVFIYYFYMLYYMEKHLEDDLFESHFVVEHEVIK